MDIISIEDPSAIPQAIHVLHRGGTIIYPTETCYGIGVDSTNQQAVTKLLSYKGDRHRQVSIAVSNLEMAKQYVTLNNIAHNLYQEFLPGPITVISKSKGSTDPRLESADHALGIRWPAHQFALSLITRFGKPITATSANTSGKKEPYSLQDWQKYTVKSKWPMVDLFLDAGKLTERPTSTVVDTTLNDPSILRQGSLTLPSLHQSFLSHNPSETQAFASQLISRYLPLTRRFPLLLALIGELGTGKTQFVQGLRELLQLQDHITSPTYTLLHEYPYQLTKYQGTLYHLDTWRLSDMTELDTTLGLSQLLQPGNILAMEWAGKANSWLNRYQNDYPILVIKIKELEDHSRQINYAFTTPEWS